MRVHELHGDHSRFPFAWVADNSTLGAAFRSALQLRYALIPQLYSWLHHAEAELQSIVAPAIDLFPPPPAIKAGSSASRSHASADSDRSRSETPELSSSSSSPSSTAAGAGAGDACPWSWQYMLGGVLLPASHDGIEGSGTAGHSNVTARLPPGPWFRFNSTGEKTVFLTTHLYIYHHHFTKTGSGQT
jgi:hypothetical protein